MGNSFYHLSIENMALTLQWGTLQSTRAPLLRTTHFTSPDAAVRRFDKLVRDRLKKGFVVAEAPMGRELSNSTSCSSLVEGVSGSGGGSGGAGAGGAGGGGGGGGGGGAVGDAGLRLQRKRKAEDSAAAAAANGSN